MLQLHDQDNSDTVLPASEYVPLLAIVGPGLSGAGHGVVLCITGKFVGCYGFFQIFQEISVFSFMAGAERYQYFVIIFTFYEQRKK